MATATRITNTELGERLGIHYTMASRLLNGKRLPGPELVMRISAEFGVPVEDVMRARNAGHDAFAIFLREAVKTDD